MPEPETQETTPKQEQELVTTETHYIVVQKGLVRRECSCGCTEIGVAGEPCSNCGATPKNPMPHNK